jgi:DNA-binding transcriptional LysR family regulator
MARRRTINLNRLSVFASVVEAGSFTAASDRLGLAKAMVSQHITRLEAELGAALLVRTTRRLTLTEAGQTFHADCRRILAETEAAVARVGSSGETPTGTLRLTAAAGYGAAVLAPALAAFVDRFPAVTIDLVATDQIVDLIGERFDLAIRTGWLRDSRLRAVRLGTFQQFAVGTPDYLHRAGTPRHPRDLARHRWIALSLLRTPLTWSFTSRDGASHTVRVTAPVRTNTAAAVHAFVLAGSGVSVLTNFEADSDIATGRLVHLLPSYRLPEGGVYAVHPATRYTPAKVKAFIQFFRDYLRDPAHTQ